MPLLKTIPYERFWKELVADARDVVAEALGGLNISEPAYLDDVKTWVARAVPELQTWCNFQTTDDHSHVRTIGKLSHLPKEIVKRSRTKSGRQALLKELTSVSLLRLLPFRRTMLWDRHNNALLPREYVRERIEKKETSLASGETAFAAFATNFDPYKKGMVVNDCKEDLRGTHFLTDRALGLRSNAIVPMRSQGRGKEAGVTLAIMVISLPFANAFGPDITEKLQSKFHKYEDQLQIMWEFEQLQERYEFEEKEYPKDEVEAIIGDLTPDAYLAGDTGVEDARLPGCAIIAGEASGAGGIEAAVSVRSARISVSPRHHSLFVQSELELSGYGIDGRCFTLEEFSSLCSFGPYHLMYLPNAAAEYRPPAAFRMLQRLGEAVNQTFELGGEASLLHRRLDTQRGLFSHLLDYLATGRDSRQRILLEDMQYICSNSPRPFDAPNAKNTLGELRKWVEQRQKNIRYLTICLDSEALSLVSPTGSKSYLWGFRVFRRGDNSSFVFLGEHSWDDHRQLRDAAHELSGPRRFIAWCRAMTALVTAAVPPDSERNFKLTNFSLYSPDSKRPVAYFPSLLLPDGSTLRINRRGKSVTVNIEYADGYRLESTWLLGKKLISLATAVLQPVVFDVPDLNVKLFGLSAREKALFFDLRRLHVGTLQRDWSVPTFPKNEPVAELFTKLAVRLPEWVGSMDCLAVVPLPFKDALEIPSFSKWSEGSGERRMLVAGILRRTSERDVWAERDVELSTDREQRDTEDPFLERFWNLLDVVQKRQKMLRWVERLRQNETIFTHLSHDVCSEMNLRSLDGVLSMLNILLRQQMSKAPGIKLDPKDLIKVQRQLIEARLLNDDLGLLRLLSGKEIKQVSPPPTIDDVLSYVHHAVPRAARHAALKILSDYMKRSAGQKVTDETKLEKDLEAMLVFDAVKPGVESGSPLVLVMLDNLLRNAFEGVWSYRQTNGGAARGEVRISLRERDSCIAITNDAEPGRWEKIKDYYDNIGDNLGIATIRSIADRLNIKVFPQVLSETRGEMQLIIER
jgi:signal transduction histidine kinase